MKEIIHVVPNHWKFLSVKNKTAKLILPLLGWKFLLFFKENGHLFFFNRRFDNVFSTLFQKFGNLLLGRKIWQISFSSQTIPYINIPKKEKNLILDIDLDFFIENIPTYNIQISKASYDNFRKKYQGYFSNIFPRFHLTKFGRKYFLTYLSTDALESIKTKLLPRIDKSMIKKNVTSLCNILAKKVKPDIITIARSSYSEYSNKKYLEFTESILLKTLKDIYDLQVFDVNVD